MLLFLFQCGSFGREACIMHVLLFIDERWYGNHKPEIAMDVFGSHHVSNHNETIATSECSTNASVSL